MGSVLQALTVVRKEYCAPPHTYRTAESIRSEEPPPFGSGCASSAVTQPAWRPSEPFQRAQPTSGHPGSALRSCRTGASTPNVPSRGLQNACIDPGSALPRVAEACIGSESVSRDYRTRTSTPGAPLGVVQNAYIDSRCGYLAGAERVHRLPVHPLVGCRTRTATPGTPTRRASTPPRGSLRPHPAVAEPYPRLDCQRSAGCRERAAAFLRSALHAKRACGVRPRWGAAPPWAPRRRRHSLIHAATCPLFTPRACGRAAPGSPPLSGTRAPNPPSS